MTSPFQEILSIAHRTEAALDPLLEVTVQPIAPRAPNEDVFAAGADFGGMQQLGDAEACIKPVPSGHVSPTVPIDQFLAASREVVGPGANLPVNIPVGSSIANQLLVWWRSAEDPNGSRGLPDISSLPPSQRQDFYHLIASETTRAQRIVASLGGTAILWGSWGHATPAECLVSGRNRGAPSHPSAHLHVADFSQDCSVPRPAASTTTAERLGHYSPLAV